VVSFHVVSERISQLLALSARYGYATLSQVEVRIRVFDTGYRCNWGCRTNLPVAGRVPKFILGKIFVEHVSGYRVRYPVSSRCFGSVCDTSVQYLGPKSFSGQMRRFGFGATRITRIFIRS
jgi:hypothetical protein